MDDGKARTPSPPPHGAPQGRPAPRRLPTRPVCRPGPGPAEIRKRKAKRIVLALAGLAGILLVCAAAIHELLGSFAVRQGGMNALSLDEEWTLGKEIHRAIAKDWPLSEDAEAQAFLDSIGQSIAKQTPLADRPWSFHVLDAPFVNALNVPGGHVYVTTALIREAQSLDELAGVLGHEVAHGAARHTTQMLTRAIGADAVLSRLGGGQGPPPAQLAAELALLSYSRDAEREADRLGAGYSFDAGYSPRGLLRFLERIRAQEGGGSPAFAQFLSTHPLTEERLESLRAQVGNMLTVRVLQEDTEEYQRFRARFLPPKE